MLSLIPRHLGKDAIGKFFSLQGILILLALVFMTGGETAGRIIRTILATAIMGAAMWATRNLFLAVPLILGWSIFAVLTPVLSLLPPEEQLHLNGMFAKLTGKLRRF